MCLLRALPGRVFRPLPRSPSECGLVRIVKGLELIATGSPFGASKSIGPAAGVAASCVHFWGGKAVSAAARVRKIPQYTHGHGSITDFALEPDQIRSNAAARVTVPVCARTSTESVNGATCSERCTLRQFITN